jgi:hypothetical protein
MLNTLYSWGDAPERCSLTVLGHSYMTQVSITQLRHLIRTLS